MRTKILFLCCLFIAVFVSTVWAQSPDFESTKPTPNESGLIKSIQSSVNYFNGTMNIQIPLYTLSEFELNVPISLRYNTSGIKVEDVASSVGLGWDLSAGGKITRLVKRNPDELANGFISESKVPLDQEFRLYPYDADWSLIDREPDLFYFEIPNYSGIFIFDNGGKICTIPYQNINIRWVDKTYFEITDPNGVKYTLGSQNSSREMSSYCNGDKTVRYNSTWLMDTMEDQFGHKIWFGYEAGDDVLIKNPRIAYTFDVGLPADTPAKDPSKDNYKAETKNAWMSTAPKYLARIQNLETTIFFEVGSRSDVEKALKYDRFYITTDGVTHKIVSFEYSQFKNGALKLDAVYEESGSAKELIAKFNYYTAVNLPGRDSKDIDHWGYYNGKSNTTLFPSFTHSKMEFTGANRNPDILFAQANTLTRIDYKTGGSTEYRYELNTVQEDGQTVNVGGLRIKEIVQDADGRKDVTALRYTTSISGGESTGIRIGRKPYYANSYSSGSTTTFFVTSHPQNDNPYPGDNIVEYYRVGEKLPNGSYNYYEYLSEKDAECADTAATVYVAYLGFHDRTIQWQKGTSRFWRRGLLRKTQHYDANNKLIGSITNNYSFGEPRAIVRGYYPYGIVGGIRLVFAYQWVSEPVILDETITEAGVYNARSTVSFTYDPTYLVPTEIKTVDGAGIVTVKNITYPFNYPNFNPTTVDVEALAQLQQRGIIVPVETTQTRSNKVINGEYLSYKLISIKNSAGVTRTAVVPASKWNLALTNSIATSDFTPAKFTKVVSSSPLSVSWSLKLDSRYKQKMIYDHYNADGQLLCSHAPNGIMKSTIYGNHGKQVIAEIDNAKRTESLDGVFRRDNQVFHTSFEDNTDTSYSAKAKTGNKTYFGSYNIDLRNFAPGTYILSYWMSPDYGESWERVSRLVTVNSSSTSYTIGGSYCIDEVRMSPLDARMTTSTYRPDGVKISETDVNEMSLFYKYDEFGRLIHVSDNQHLPIKSYEHYFRR